MLSNMTERNSIENKSLKEWIDKNKYRVIKNQKVTLRNRQDRREIIIINY